jgi:hypothetical protein
MQAHAPAGSPSAPRLRAASASLLPVGAIPIRRFTRRLSYNTRSACGFLRLPSMNRANPARTNRQHQTGQGPEMSGAEW